MALGSLRDALEAFCLAADLPFDSGADIERACALTAELPRWAAFPTPWASDDSLSVTLYGIRELCAHQIKANEQFSALSAVWKPEFFTLNGAVLAAELSQAEGKWALARTLALNALFKKLAPYAVAAVPKDSLGEQLAALAAAQTELAEARRGLDRPSIGNVRHRAGAYGRAARVDRVERRRVGGGDIGTHERDRGIRRGHGTR